MYRAPYKKPGTETESNICANCNSNGYHREVEEMTVWRCSDNDLLFEDDYSHVFSEAPVEVSGWWCERCDNFSEECDIHVEVIWVCAQCREEWEDYDSAAECCSEDEDD